MSVLRLRFNLMRSFDKEFRMVSRKLLEEVGLVRSML